MEINEDYRWLGQSKINSTGGIQLPPHIRDIMQAKPKNYVNYYIRLGTGEIIIQINPNKQLRV